VNKELLNVCNLFIKKNNINRYYLYEHHSCYDRGHSDIHYYFDKNLKQNGITKSIWYNYMCANDGISKISYCNSYFKHRVKIFTIISNIENDYKNDNSDYLNFKKLLKYKNNNNLFDKFIKFAPTLKITYNDTQFKSINYTYTHKNKVIIENNVNYLDNTISKEGNYDLRYSEINDKPTKFLAKFVNKSALDFDGYANLLGFDNYYNLKYNYLTFISKYHRRDQIHLNIKY
jgi:hypothetical protein